MKKDSIRTTRSERERYEQAAKIARNIANAFEDHQEVDIYERILDGPTGPQSRDGLELMIVSVQEMFEQEKWPLPSFDVTPTDEDGADTTSRACAAIRSSAEKMRSGSMSREQFVLGTAQIIDNILAISNSALIVAFHLYYVLLTARQLRKTNPDEAVNLVAHCGIWLARLVVLLDSARRRQGAASKMSRDPVQAAKADAKKLWLERRAGKHPDLRRNWQFAAECVRRWPALTSPDTIKGWCTKWEKEAHPKNKRAS